MKVNLNFSTLLVALLSFGSVFGVPLASPEASSENPSKSLAMSDYEPRAVASGYKSVGYYVNWYANPFALVR